MKALIRVQIGKAGLALLIVCLQNPFTRAQPGIQQEFTETQLELWVFQQDGGNAANARRRMDSRLQIQLDELHLACHLSDAQKKKLQLAGRGDVKHFFDRFEELLRKFKPFSQNQHDFQQTWQRVWQEIRPLQASLQGGLFEGDSLFAKSLANTLTAAQKVSYATLLAERRRFRHRDGVAQVVLMLEKSMRLTQTQRRKLTELILEETKPPRRSSPYDQYYLLEQLSSRPDQKIRQILDDVQRLTFDQLARQAANVAQSLRGNNLWPGDDADEDVEKPAAAKPTADKKK